MTNKLIVLIFALINIFVMNIFNNSLSLYEHFLRGIIVNADRTFQLIVYQRSRSEDL